MKIEIARFTEDVDALTAFYTVILGRQRDVRSERIAIFFIGDVKLFIHETGLPARDLPPNMDHIAFSFDDVDAAVLSAKEAGVLCEMAPRNYDWGRSAYLRDPDGRLVEMTAG